MMRFLSCFFHREEGSTMPFIALGTFMLIGATGTAIDMGRVQIVQTRMQNALDAAGLAVGSQVSTINVQSETNKYFYANFPANYLGTRISSLSAEPNSDSSVINLAVSGTVDTTFMKIFGINTVNVAATSQINRAAKGMELVLVIDNTGSMLNSAGGTISKLSAAKTAANSLLDTVFGANTNTIANLWVGLVPFSQSVNVGTSHSSWTTNATLNWGDQSWGGCVESRSNGTASPQYDITEDPPSTQLFKKYYWPDDGTNNWITTTTTQHCTGSGKNRQCTTTTTTTYDHSYSSSLGDEKGPNADCPQPVTPLTASKNTVVSAINSMTAQGNTHIDLGLAWGWRMLSPSWRSLWGGEMNTNSLPLDYNTPLMNKVVVLMTDGDNTITDGLYSAYDYPDNGQLGSNACNSYGTCTTGINELNTRTSTVCTSMKSRGIIIYTIALGSNVSTAGRTLLQNCATKPEFYFLSPTTNELQGIFQTIGDSLANLRVSQ